MKNKYNYNYQKKKKGQSKALTITLFISAVLMTGLVIWLGMNDWSVEKSAKQFQEIVGPSTPIVEDAALPKEEPSEVEIVIDEENPVKPAEQLPAKPVDKGEKELGSTAKPSASIDKGGYIEGQELPSEPTYVRGILIANKKNPLPSTFAPGEDKAARTAFDQMAAEATLSGFKLTAFSTYRAFDYQTTLYERYVARDGKEAADTYSARPGYSEHQTGLAFDIGEVNFEKHWASSSFGETEAGKWVAANAHRFGFIMRYPEGKEPVTGYMHESWHFRYVGIEIANEIFERKITLEEYLGI
ncbi:M15 family metallopeptidase [Sporosarcina sp. YIM B06819]|uniref:M15 family metallopeptidase n=1 Tax=Sporosarcina sp. YIM B06819 TaxID=3081769 RepID=UPI00298CA2EE|nr:M15 family metallopeptidase [Sporosarcina sp. YIM B06819]